MAEKLKDEKKPKVTIKLGDSSVSIKYKDLLKELDRIVRVNRLFMADEITFRSFCDIRFDNLSLNLAYEKFILKEIETAFGCIIPKSYLDLPILDVCLFLEKNRTNTPALETFRNFLGIIGLKNLTTNDLFVLTYPFSIKAHVDYQTGWLHGKPAQMDEHFYKELDSFRNQVYGKYPFKIKTEEGDILTFANLYEVCCWMQARVSNYNPDSFRKGNW